MSTTEENYSKILKEIDSFLKSLKDRLEPRERDLGKGSPTKFKLLGIITDTKYKLPSDFSAALTTVQKKFETLKEDFVKLKSQIETISEIEGLDKLARDQLILEVDKLAVGKLNELTKTLTESLTTATYPSARVVFQHALELLENIPDILNENSTSQLTTRSYAP